MPRSANRKKAGPPKEPTVLVTGGKGILAAEIKKLIRVTSVDRDDFDITDREAARTYLTQHPHDILIHCAAYTDVAGAETHRDACFRANVTGTENLVRHFTGSRFVYISTDYVFDGERGNYAEDDVPNPLNYYALTKLLGETVVRQHPRTLIIRTSFKPNGAWEHPGACTDMWTSAEYVSEIAPDILRAALMPGLYGIVHVAGPRKTIYDLAKKNSPSIKRMLRKDAVVALPHDVSLDSSYWLSIQKP